MSLTNTDPSEHIKERIRSRLTALGISANEASRKAGIGISYINDLLSGKSRSPSVTMLAKVADALECDLEFILGFQASPHPDPKAKEVRSTTRPPIPLYSVTMTEPDGYFPMKDSDVTEFFPATSTEPAGSFYAITVGDDMMAPRFMAGEIVCANTRKPIAVNSFVVVRLTSDRAIIRQVRQINAETIELYSIALSSCQKLSRSDIKSIHRITATFEG